MHGLSIIIPSFNRETKLFKNVRQLNLNIAKLKINAEIIIVVDGSNYSNLNQIQLISKSIVIIVNKHNVGVARSRNTAASHAKYDWLLFMDDDDCLFFEYLSNLIKSISKNDISEALFYFAPAMIKSNESTYTTDFLDKKNQNDLYRNLIKSGASYGFCINKKIFFTIGAFDQRYIVGEDTEFFCRIMQHSIRGKMLPGPSVFKREDSADRLSSNFQKYSTGSIYESIIIDNHETLIKHPKIFFNLLIWVMKVHESNKNMMRRNNIKVLLKYFGFDEKEIHHSISTSEDIIISAKTTSIIENLKSNTIREDIKFILTGYQHRLNINDPF